ncbi:hypothetical protein HAX54_050637, partial [Datura stramonium]|nr:hypothetical protein [Datura stramonium]
LESCQHIPTYELVAPGLLDELGGSFLADRRGANAFGYSYRCPRTCCPEGLSLDTVIGARRLRYNYRRLDGSDTVAGAQTTQIHELGNKEVTSARFGEIPVFTGSCRSSAVEYFSLKLSLGKRSSHSLGNTIVGQDTSAHLSTFSHNSISMRRLACEPPIRPDEMLAEAQVGVRLQATTQLPIFTSASWIMTSDD